MNKLLCLNWDDSNPRLVRDAITGAIIGTLMPRISRRRLNASAGICSHSIPGNTSAVTLYGGDASIEHFAAHWTRHTGRTYPFST